MPFLALLALAVAGSREPDVIVVGAGCGGLATAYEASAGGAFVTVVDLASVFGGHAVVSEGGLSFPGTPLQASLGVRDSPDQMYADVLRMGEDADEGWAETPWRASTGIPNAGSAWSSWCIAPARAQVE